jgi:dTDP-4-dehydrorhamnose reductase
VRVLVTGAGGLLGGRLAPLLAGSHAVTAAWRERPAPPGLPSVRLDVLDAASLQAALESARPEAVVHCAALADPDRCENDPELAERLNVAAAAAVARACHGLGLRLVAASTDLVLTGNQPYATESAATAPRLVYGRSKLAGEQAVLAECPGAAVVRVALVHGRGHGLRSTASESVAWSLRTGRPLRLFTDQQRTPIDPESVAGALHRLLPGTQAGVFHLGGPERLSRYELGLRVARLLGLPTDSIEPVRQAETGGVARPADVSLDSSRARRELDWSPRPLDAGLREGRGGPDTAIQATSGAA